MDELFEDVLFLVPVALALFLRVFAGWRKAEKAKNASVLPAAAQKAPAKRPAAASTLARLYEKLTGTVPASAGPLEPLHFEEKNARPVDYRPTPQAARQRDPSPEPRAPEPRAAEPVQKPQAKRKPQAAAGSRLPAALERLPPLQRAVALSEILGEPRSLR